MIPQSVHEFQAVQHIGLPVPFNITPVSLDDKPRMWGFGPNYFALNNWKKFYSSTRGMHNGFDFVVPTGTPLVAVADGVVIKTWPFMRNAQDINFVLWPRLPDGTMSNVLLAFAHMKEILTPHLSFVTAGTLLGYTGHPPNAPQQAHLHMEAHFIAGDVGFATIPPNTDRLLSQYPYPQTNRNQVPYNPLYFFSQACLENLLQVFQERSATPHYPHHSHVGRKEPLDLFSLSAFRYSKNSVWEGWRKGLLWEEDLVNHVNGFEDFAPFTL